MALQLSKDTNLGVPALYWRITGVSVDAASKRFSIQIVGYISADARRVGKQPVTSLTLGNSAAQNAGRRQNEQQLSPADALSAYNSLIANPSGLVVAAYDFLKSRPEFSGAADA